MKSPISVVSIATLPANWDQDNAIMMNDEEISATSHEEAGKVFEQWQADDQDLDMMEVDEQLGANLLSDDIFQDPCVSPTGPLEELSLMNLDEEDIDRFSLSLFSEDELNDKTSSLPFDERYQATLKKLSESMQRSQETRKSLRMKSDKTEEYSRTTSVCGVLNSIEKSSHQLQSYLKNINRV